MLFFKKLRAFLLTFKIHPHLYSLCWSSHSPQKTRTWAGCEQADLCAGHWVQSASLSSRVAANYRCFPLVWQDRSGQSQPIIVIQEQRDSNCFHGTLTLHQGKLDPIESICRHTVAYTLTHQIWFYMNSLLRCQVVLFALANACTHKYANTHELLLYLFDWQLPLQLWARSICESSRRE